MADKSEVEIIRYQVLIPVSEVQVRQLDPVKGEAATEAATTANFSWELVHLRNQTQRRSEKIYLLSNSTTEFRNAFLRNIRQIIRESVRNMSLPPRLADGSSDGGEGGAGAGGSGTEGPGGASSPPTKETSHYATPEGRETNERPSYSSQAQTLGRIIFPKSKTRIIKSYRSSHLTFSLVVAAACSASVAVYYSSSVLLLAASNCFY